MRRQRAPVRPPAAPRQPGGRLSRRVASVAGRWRDRGDQIAPTWSDRGPHGCCPQCGSTTTSTQPSSGAPRPKVNRRRPRQPQSAERTSAQGHSGVAKSASPRPDAKRATASTRAPVSRWPGDELPRLVGRPGVWPRSGPASRSDGLGGECFSLRPLCAYVEVEIVERAMAWRRRTVTPGEEANDDLVWSADGPHAIRSRPSSAVNNRTCRSARRPAFPGPTATCTQPPSTTINKWGSRSQGGSAGSNPVGATPLHTPASGGWSHCRVFGSERGWLPGNGTEVLQA
jgi:hypothetical protein